MLPNPNDINAYRQCRHDCMVGEYGIRAYLIEGDLIRHSELHRDLQRGLVKVREYFANVR